MVVVVFLVLAMVAERPQTDRRLIIALPRLWWLYVGYGEFVLCWGATEVGWWLCAIIAIAERRNDNDDDDYHQACYAGRSVGRLDGIILYQFFPSQLEVGTQL